MSYINLNYRPSETDLVCLFRVEPSRGISIKQVAENIAGESSTGTWVKLKVSPKIRNLGAKVFSIKGNYIKIAYPLELFELDNMSQILSSIAGNIFGMKSVRNLRLEDVQWPYEIVKSFKGPLFGIEGIRKLLIVPKRPLCGTIIKPKLGLNEEEHAKVAYEAWRGGIDIVKDDENLSDLSFNHFAKRVIETLKMRDKAEEETGERKVYMPNITAEIDTMLERANFVKETGGEYAMVDIITIGWSALENLRSANEDLKLVLHGHRAGHAAFTRGKHGISMVVVADVARLIGIDQLHIGTIIGKMEGIKEEILTVEEEIEKKIVKEHDHTLAEDWHHIKPVFAVCSGGLHPGLVPFLIKNLGNDIIIQAGGGVHGHPLGTESGANAFRQAIDAVMNNISLKEYAKKHKELRIALETWK